MNIQGTLTEIFETSQVTDTFQKREFVVEYAENPQYPEFIKFELIQDRCDLIDSFKQGDNVDVWFNIKGRKWTDPEGNVKYFNSLQAWKIRPMDSSGGDDDPLQDVQEPEWSKGDEKDELPF